MKTYVALLAVAFVLAVSDAKRTCSMLQAAMADKKDCGGAGKDSTVCRKMAFHACKRNCDEVQGADTSLAYCEEHSGYKVLCPAFDKRFKKHGCDAPAADDVKRCARIAKAMDDRRCSEVAEVKEEVTEEETAKPEENTKPEENAAPEDNTKPEENGAPEDNTKPEENAEEKEEEGTNYYNYE